MVQPIDTDHTEDLAAGAITTTPPATLTIIAPSEERTTKYTKYTKLSDLSCISCISWLPMIVLSEDLRDPKRLEIALIFPILRAWQRQE